MNLQLSGVHEVAARGTLKEASEAKVAASNSALSLNGKGYIPTPS